MRLTEQQRAELARRGWRPKQVLDSTMYEKLIRCDDGDDHACAITVVTKTGEIEGIGGPIEGILELVAILGISPPGYRLVPDWRQFESAPQDGTEILAYRPDAGVFTAVYRPGLDEGGQDTDEWRWFSTDGEDLTSDLPTHWMPLPDGPVASALQGKEGETGC